MKDDRNTRYKVNAPAFAAFLTGSCGSCMPRQQESSHKDSGQGMGCLQQPFRRYSFTFFSFCFLITILLFSSCEKVITPELDEAPKKVVIEGNIAFGDSTRGVAQEVRISETRSFTDDNTSDHPASFGGLSGAVVTVSAHGDSVRFQEVYSGVYRSFFDGVPGTTYHLTVQLSGITYTAVSTMPAQVVTLDSLWAEALVFGGSTNITIYPQYNDPKGLGNNYRLVEYANDTLVRKAFPQNDEFSDGNTVTRPLINPDSKLERGDYVTVFLQCIDPAVYKYWYSLDAAATGNNQSATPTNPVTNINGGALGYFSAYTETSYSFRIP